MSRNMKIILGIVAVVLLVGCIAMLGVGMLGARMAANMMDPAKAEEIAHEITDYTLPEGYKPFMGLNLMGAKMAMFGPPGLAFGSGGANGMPSDGVMIMFMQAPASAANADQMREQMMKNMGGQTGADGSLEATGTMDATIRGKPVTLQVSEGKDRRGNDIKAISGVFDGIGGPSMIMIIGRPENFDAGTVDDFLASMK